MLLQTKGFHLITKTHRLFFNNIKIHTIINKIIQNYSLLEGDIIDRGIREHPELGIGMTTEGIEVRSVGNTLTLHESALIEAFNLKAAIQFEKNDSKKENIYK